MLKQTRLTDEHGFWCVFWVIAMAASLLWDAALHRTPDIGISLLDVTSLTLALAVGTRIGMRRSASFRCWISLVIYLSMRWVRDWLMVLIISFLAIPVVMLICAPLGAIGVRIGLVAYALITAAFPTVRLLRNVRLLQPVNDSDELWRFGATPRWLFG